MITALLILIVAILLLGRDVVISIIDWVITTSIKLILLAVLVGGIAALIINIKGGI